MKKGELTIEVVVQIIIGVAVAFLLVMLAIKLFSPTFEKRDMVSESYFKMFESAISDADAGSVGSFYILNDGDKEVGFYLVYFDNMLQIEKSFSKEKEGKNSFCICSKEKSIVCKYCMNLKSGVDFFYENGDNPKFHIFKESSVIGISKVDGRYKFDVR